MWMEDYANAQIYARKAIDESGATPTTQEQWLNATSGFNDISVSSWMFGSTMQKEDDVVKSVSSTGLLGCRMKRPTDMQLPDRCL